MKLRPYQHEAIAAVHEAWSNGPDRPAVVLPTGSGKTVIFSELTRSLDGQRVLILVHRDELVTQTVAKLRAFGVTAGVVKAERNDHHFQVVVATVQTLYREARVTAMGAFSHVIFDEMHHATSRQNRLLLERLGVFDGRTLSVGFTATFTREDARHLANDWTVVYERDPQWMIERGYLSDVEAFTVVVPDLDLSGLSSRSGDFTDKATATAMSESSAATLIPQAWRKYADGRPTILFAPTIASCEDLAAGLSADGIVTETVFGHTPQWQRHEIYERVRAGTTSVLASVSVLTEGFDLPAISCAILARPTKSSGLWQQMAGRALRTYPGKDKAILLDITGDAGNHSLASITSLTRGHSAAGESSPRGTAYCECLAAACCSPVESRDECLRNQRANVCYCLCACAPGDDDGLERITLVRGAHDLEIDLFAGSTTVWLKTTGGNWFIPTRQRLYFIAWHEGGYRAGRTGTPYAMSGGSWLCDPMDEEMALTIAQEAASTEDPSVASRTATWRRQKPSEAQVAYAAGLGIQTEGLRRGPVSDAISIALASPLLDPKFP